MNTSSMNTSSDAKTIQPVSHQVLAPWLGGRSFAEWKEQFDTQGYVIFDDVLAPEKIRALRAAIDPHLQHTGRNSFEGHRTNRVYGLLAKEPDSLSDVAGHPLALAFAEAELGDTCLLSAFLAINLHPGETVQPWHHDDNFIEIPLPRPSFGVSTFWAIDAMTSENGATEIIPGSHLWSAADAPTGPIKDQLDKSDDQARDLQTRDDSIQVTLSSGSLMVTKGTLWHRGGANHSNGSRLIITPQYCPGWARQIENMMAAVPPSVAAHLPTRVRQLLGYSIHGGFMGYVDGVHPEKLLHQ
jgi:ectoine hydroxylase-related dioxygenase (phytanoyl-CoA dioxygenase family)